MTELWRVARELGRLTARIRNRRLAKEERLYDLIDLELLLGRCAEDTRISGLTSGFKDKRREGILTYDIPAVETFVGQMLYTYPSPESYLEPVYLRALVKVGGKQVLYGGMAVPLEERQTDSLEGITGVAVCTMDGDHGYVGHIEQMA